MSLSFTIPGRPTAWQRAREFVHRQSGKIVRSNPPEMIKQQERIRTLAKLAGQSGIMAGPVRLEVLCVYRIPPSWPQWKQDAARTGRMWKTSVPDHDNLLKQISDALNKQAYGDDAQIVQTSFGKRYGYPERTEVRLTPVDALCDHSTRGQWEALQEALRGQGSLPGLASKPCNTQTGGTR